MKYTELANFIQVYRNKSFSAAARIIPISIQGLSKQIRSLESELGVPLFETRDGKRRPTNFADMLYEYAILSLNTYNSFLDSLNDVKSSAGHVISICSSQGVGWFLGSDFCSSFYPSNKNVILKLGTEKNDQDTDKALHDGKFDFAFTTTPFDSKFITIPICKTKFMILVNSSDALAVKSSVDIADLVNYQLCFPNRHIKVRNIVERLAEAQSVYLDFGWDGNDWMRMKQTLTEKNGMTCMLEAWADELVETSQHTAVPINQVYWGFGFSYLKDRFLTQSDKELISYVKALKKRLLGIPGVTEI